MRGFIILRFTLLILFVNGLVVSRSYSQVPQGQVLGTISDPSGALIPGATVTLKNEQTGITHSEASDKNGDYAFLYLDSGTYSVTVQKDGFATTVSGGIRVQVEEKKRVDVKLKLGTAHTEVVQVTGAAAKVDTDSATIGSMISSREVIGLPLNGREFSQLALLSPGVLNEGTTGGALITTFATAVQVGGTNYGKNAYTIDGADNTFNVWNGPAMNPSVDSIQEFRIDRSQFSAEYGRGGAEMELATKSGTNQFHGAFWDYLRNADLDAGNYVTHQQDTLKQNQFGANLGGPILKNKAFFFFNWEGQQQHSTTQPLGTVFTSQMRTGDLSQFGTPIIDPQTGQPFTGGIIPTSRLDPVALSYMNAMLAPANQPGSDDGILNNFVRPFVTALDWNQYITRIDYQATEKDSLFLRFNVQPRNGIDAPLSATSVNSVEDMQFANTSLGWTRTWSPRMLSEVRLGYHGEMLNIGNAKVTNLPNPVITGFDGFQPAQDRLPELTVAPYYSFDEWGFPWVSTQNTYQLIANLTVTFGKHIVKMGFDGRHQLINRVQFSKDVIAMDFTGAYTGNGVGDYLLGLPFTASQTVPPADRVIPRLDTTEFIQDDWKVNSSFTVNLGLRYEINTQPTDIHNRVSGFDPSLQMIAVAGNQILTQYIVPPLLAAYGPFLIPASQTNLPSRTLIFGDHNDLAPRIGFAWRPFKDNKEVVRGGYGIYYLLGDGNIDAQQAVSAVPYGGSVAVTNTTVPSFTMDAPFGAGVSTPPPPSPFYFDPHRRDGYLQQASIGVERELPYGIVFELNGQDQNSKKLETSWNLNQPPASTSTLPLQTRRPYPQFGAAITDEEHNGHTRYDALEVSLRKATPHLTFQWNHTWAKNIGVLSPVDPYHMDEFYGPLNYVPNLDKLSFVASLPFGQGQHWSTQQKVLDTVAGGWMVSGIGDLYEGGQPLNLSWVGDPSNTGTYVAVPNQICSGYVAHKTQQEWFNTSCFVAPTLGTFGNTQPGVVFGPSAFSYDLALLKNFSVTEKTHLQFRSEFFNAFNHPTLADPGLSANSTGFGEILTKNQTPRVIQFALRLTF